MFDYLQKFNKLPQELRDKVSSPEVMQAISEIEKKYNVSLAIVVMRVMVKDISLVDLAKYFVFEHQLSGEQANQLIEELKTKVFLGVADYLDLGKEEKEAGDKKALDKWMDSRQQETKARGASFFFSSEDEEEIKELAKKVENYVTTSKEPTFQIDEKIDQIIKEININFSSEELANRFKQILKIYFKGIRNKIDTKQTLSKSVEAGGLGMDPNFVEAALSSIDKIKEKWLDKPVLKPPAKIKLPEDEQAVDLVKKDKLDQPEQDQTYLSRKEEEKGDKPITSLKSSGVRDLGYDFSKLASPAKEKIVSKQKDETILKQTADKEQEAPEKLDHSDLSHLDSEEKEPSIIPASTSLPDDKTGAVEERLADEKVPKSVKEKDRDKQIGDKDHQVKETEPAAINIINVRRPLAKATGLPAQTGKVKMQDVKYVPKLMGPIDELREMDLVNFRRLSQDPIAATAKIKEKIKFLEEEGYSQRLSGIKAWRQCPVNKLYLAIGQESMSHKKPINVIIEGKRTAHQDYLTSQEFASIMDLNKSLRF